MRTAALLNFKMKNLWETVQKTFELVSFLVLFLNEVCGGVLTPLKFRV